MDYIDVFPSLQTWRPRRLATPTPRPSPRPGTCERISTGRILCPFLVLVLLIACLVILLVFLDRPHTHSAYSSSPPCHSLFPHPTNARLRNTYNAYVNQLWKAQETVIREATHRCGKLSRHLYKDRNDCRYLLGIHQELLNNGRPFVSFGEVLADPTIPDHEFHMPEPWRRVI